MSTFTLCKPCTHFTHTQGPDVTPLAPYIHHASQIHIKESATSEPVFPNLAIPPMLRRNRQNRILVLAGCFDSPHMGHLELLAHVFLRTNSVTVTAMTVPMNEKECTKGSGIVKGKQFVLTKDERKTLWQGEVLSRMAWVYTGAVSELNGFQATVMRSAAEDAYHVSFTGLAGSDH
jgi:glycerol-3-phosphate cytidylyltransferase-like family protein